MPFARGARYIRALERATELETTLTEYHYDPVTDSLIVKESQDVEPILDWCAEQRVHNANGRASLRGRLGRYVAEVPNIVIAQWMKDRCTCEKGAKRQMRQGLAPEHGFSVYTCDSRVLRQKLRDSAFSRLRTSDKPRDRVGAGWGK